MAYVGTPIDTTNQFQSLQGKRFSGNASTTAFTLDIAPSSVFDIEVFVENVRQDPNSAYSISGTTLTFTGAPPSGTNNIYVVHQAKAVGTIDVPASGVVPASLASNIISGQTELAATPADTDEFLISDAGTIKRIDFSHIKGQGKIAQVVQATSTTVDSQSASAGNFYGVGPGVNITPTSTSSKILVMVNLSLGNSADGKSIVKIVRTIGGSDTNLLTNTGGTDVNGTFGGFFDSDGNKLSTVNFSFLDSPSTTSQCTFTTQVGIDSSSTVYVNRSATDNVRGSSSMICMEVLA